MSFYPSKLEIEADLTAIALYQYYQCFEGLYNHSRLLVEAVVFLLVDILEYSYFF
jgi:hypothetical protein